MISVRYVYTHDCTTGHRRNKIFIPTGLNIEMVDVITSKSVCLTFQRWRFLSNQNKIRSRFYSLLQTVAFTIVAVVVGTWIP